MAHLTYQKISPNHDGDGDDHDDDDKNEMMMMMMNILHFPRTLGFYFSYLFCIHQICGVYKEMLSKIKGI